MDRKERAGPHASSFWSSREKTGTYSQHATIPVPGVRARTYMLIQTNIDSWEHMGHTCRYSSMHSHLPREGAPHIPRGPVILRHTYYRLDSVTQAFQSFPASSQGSGIRDGCGYHTLVWA